MRKLLLLPILIIGTLVMLPFVIWQQIRIKYFRKRTRKPPTPLTEADVAKAEQQLGFSLPSDLREFYLSGQHHRSAPCGEFYSLKGAVKEYRMLTAKPTGPTARTGLLFSSRSKTSSTGTPRTTARPISSPNGTRMKSPVAMRARRPGSGRSTPPERRWCNIWRGSGGVG